MKFHTSSWQYNCIQPSGPISGYIGTPVLIDISWSSTPEGGKTGRSTTYKFTSMLLFCTSAIIMNKRIVVALLVLALGLAEATSFWYSNLDHSGAYRGIAPNIGDSSYPVYVAVAAGDGAGIQRAINSASNGASRHGSWLASQPRVCYSYYFIIIFFFFFALIISY